MLTNKIFNSLLLFIVSFTAIGQQATIPGTYARSFDINNGGNISYELILKQDSTYSFTYYRQLSAQRPKESSYSEGNWKLLDAKKIELIASEGLINSPNFVNLSNSKAHFGTKSPRDKSNRQVPTNLRFYASEIPWFKGMQLFKK